MKLILNLILICGLNTIFPNAVKAQSTETQDPSLYKTGIIIPPVMDLIDSAMKHNATIRYRKLEIDAKNSNLISKKNSWLSNLGFQGNTQYGTVDAYTSNANGQTASIVTTSNKQLNYSVGFYIKLPFFELVNRKNQINQANTEVEQAKSMAKAQEDELREMIIKQYQDILLKQKLLNIKSLNLGNARVNMDMIEKEFRNGIIPITEYVRISDMVARIESDYEMAKTDFISAKKILEDMVGFSFQNAESKQKQ